MKKGKSSCRKPRKPKAGLSTLLQDIGIIRLQVLLLKKNILSFLNQKRKNAMEFNSRMSLSKFLTKAVILYIKTKIFLSAPLELNNPSGAGCALSEMFLQLHISKRSERGVPRIIDTYEKSVFDFRENSIMDISSGSGRNG